MSNREKKIWSDLVLDFIVAVYFFPRIFAMEGGIATNIDEVIGTIFVAIIITIVGNIVIYIAFRIGVSEKMDERDNLFEAKAHKVGYTAFFAVICFFIGHLVVNQITLEVFNFQYEDLTNSQMATYLMLSLVVVATLKDIVKLYYYRRGF